MNHLKQILRILFSLILSQAAWAASPASFTYEGVLTDSNGSAVDLTGQTLTFSVVDGSNCVIYQETSTTSGDANGMISHAVGTGSVVYGSFNAGLFNTTQTGASSCTVSASAPRFLKISIASPAISATVNITSVPYAFESSAVGGYSANSILRADSSVASVSPLNNTQYTALMNLLAGSSTLYVQQSSPSFSSQPTFSGTPSSPNDLTNKSYVDGVVSNALPNIITPGTFAKVVTDAKGRVTSGSALVQADIPQLTTAGKVDGGAINAGTIGGSTAINTSGNITTGGVVTANSVSAGTGSVNQIRIYNGSSNYVQFTAPTLAAPVLFTLPSVDGAAGQVLKTDGSGNLSWVTSAAPGDASYAAKGIVQIDTSAANSGLAFSSSGILKVNYGTGANQIVQLDASSKLPAVNGSQLTGLSLSQISAGTLPISRGGTGQTTQTLAFNALSPVTTKGDLISSDGSNNVRLPVGTNGYALTADSAQSSGLKWAPTGTVTTVVAGTGLNGGTITSTGTLSVNVGTGANQIVQLDASSKLPPVDGSTLTGLTASQISSGTIPVTRGGTGNGNFAGNGVIVSNLTGAQLSALNCGSGQVITFDGSGYAICGSAAGANAFVNGGNSFGANATLGTNDAFSLALETNNSTRMYLDTSGNIGIGNINPAARLDVTGEVRMRGTTSGYAGLKSPAVGPSVTWTLPTADGSAGQFLKTDGSGNLAWASASTSAITSINGSSVTAQTFPTPGTSGTAPSWSTNTGTGAHTLNIPMASTASVTAGLISKTDFDSFNNKIGTSTIYSGDVAGLYNALTVNQIKGVAISGTPALTTHVLQYNGSAWLPTVLNDTSKLPLTGGTLSGTLNMAGNNINNISQAILKDNSTNTITVRAPTTVPANYSFILPPNAGSSGQFLATDGTGNLSWATSTAPVDTYYGTKGLISIDTDAATSGIAFNGSGIVKVNYGTGSNQIVKLDSGSRLPNVDASQLTNLNLSNVGSGTLLVSRGGTGSSTALTGGKVMISSGGAIVEGSSYGSTKTSSTFVVRDISGGFEGGNVTMDSALLKSSSGTVTLRSSPTTSNYTLTLPDNLGSAGQVLSTDASGNLSWKSPLNGTVTNVSSSDSYLSVSNGSTAAVITANVGSSALTLAAGNDGRIIGALQKTGGAMTGSLVMNSNDVTSVGTLAMSPNKTFLLSNNSADPTGLITSDKGRMWFNSGSNQIKYFDGSTTQVLSTAGASISSINGSTVAAQTFPTPGTLGTAPTWSTNTGAGSHTLNIPMASGASVTAGLISRTDYDNFTNKLGTTTPHSGDVTGYYNNLTVDKIKNIPVSLGSLTSGQFLKYSSSAWSNAFISGSDVTGMPINQLIAANGTGSLTNFNCTSGQVVAFGVGGIVQCENINGAGQLVRLDGSSKMPAVDGSFLTSLNASNLTGTVPVNRGGTGNSSLPVTAGSVAYADGAKLTTTGPGSNGQILGFSLGAPAWQSLDQAGVIAQNGNSSFSPLTIGTKNSGQQLIFKTANTQRMLIDSNGQMYIPDMAPSGFNYASLYVNSTGNTIPLMLSNDTANQISAIDFLGYKSSFPNIETKFTLGFVNPPGTYPNYNYGYIGTSVAADLSIRTTNVDRIHVASGGNVGINTSSPSYTLHVVGTAGLSTGTAWTNASDIRLKDIDGDYEYGLDEILKLHTVRFHYKKNNALSIPSDHPMTGFIAQEVQKVIPDAVHVRGDGFLELNVDPIHWATVNAVQELHGMCTRNEDAITANAKDIQIAKRTIASMSSKIAELSTELNQVKMQNSEINKNNAEKDLRISQLESRLQKLEQLILTPGTSKQTPK